MSKTIIPCGYKSSLSLYDTQIAIGKMKRLFEDELSKVLNLKRVSAPLIVFPHTGTNDDLSGAILQRPVEFDIKEIKGENAQIVQSLAKWKRMALHHYNFPLDEGIYADMNAIRRDDEIDNTHSIYVDQWDWEKIIAPESRNLDYLKSTVTSIVDAICDTAEELSGCVRLTRTVKFITSQELEDMYPGLNPDEREHAITKEFKTVFIMQIGSKLKQGKPHGDRAPDYDDWQLNGDLLFWSDVLERAMELSSMGIRVDPATLDNQLTIAGCDARRTLTYHKELLEGNLPLTIGGGIGQSRLSMLLLGKAHIGEVQVSVWDSETIAACKAAGVELL